MAKRKKQEKVIPAVVSAISTERFQEWLVQTPLKHLYANLFALRRISSFWLGKVSEERLEDLFQRLPWLLDFIDRKVVMDRLKKIDLFPRFTIDGIEEVSEPRLAKLFGVSLEDFMPENASVIQDILGFIRSSPTPSLEKAEAWLYAVANDPESDGDYEAAVYLASRNKENVHPDVVETGWYNSICEKIEKNSFVRDPIDDSIKELARSRKITIKQATDALRNTYGELPYFVNYTDAEQYFIGATLLRTADWLQIAGYEEFWKSAIAELSSGPIEGIDSLDSPFTLFFWCRCDMALSLADSRGLDNWLWSLYQGQYDRKRPWHLWKRDGEFKNVDHLRNAASISFCAKRIGSDKIDLSITQDAVELLMQSQLRDGSWPEWADESDSDFLTTCFAIHALALWKPNNWQRLTLKGAEWLLSQQSTFGIWEKHRGVITVLTVLALDSIVLANGGSQVTFNMNITNKQQEAQEKATDVKKEFNHPKYNMDGQEWHQPAFPSITNVPYKELEADREIDIILITATETELRQVLHKLLPLSTQQNIVRVTYRAETYYLGLFGAFRAVVLKSEMGESGPLGASLVTDRAIQFWNPFAVIMIGIAFGADPIKHGAADVLIAREIHPYEVQRVGKDNNIVFRSPTPPSSHVLFSRFQQPSSWRFERPDGTVVGKHSGLILSGAKLIDNQEFKQFLLNHSETAIGGEMEGAGVWAASTSNQTEWILVKSVCDWADGYKDDTLQEMAAASATSLCLSVLSAPSALQGLRRGYQD